MARSTSPAARTAKTMAKATTKAAAKTSVKLTGQSTSSRKATKAAKKSSETTTLYRFLVGLDDASFCHRVSEALSKGWQLHGPSSLVFDATTGKVMCGQPVIKTIRGTYSPDMKLSEQ